MSLTFLEEQLKPETAKNTAKAFANIFYSKQNEETFTLERHNLIVSNFSNNRNKPRKTKHFLAPA